MNHYPAPLGPAPTFQVGQTVQTPQGDREIISVHHPRGQRERYCLNKPVLHTSPNYQIPLSWFDGYELKAWGNGPGALTGEVVAELPPHLKNTENL